MQSSSFVEAGYGKILSVFNLRGISFCDDFNLASQAPLRDIYRARMGTSGKMVQPTRGGPAVPQPSQATLRI